MVLFQRKKLTCEHEKGCVDAIAVPLGEPQVVQLVHVGAQHGLVIALPGPYQRTLTQVRPWQQLDHSVSIERRTKKV